MRPGATHRLPRQPRIITDSTAQISQAWARDHRVVVLAQHIHLDGKAYREGIDIDDAGFAALVHHRAANDWPIIEAPSIDEYIETYHHIISETPEIVVIAPSDKLTRSAQNARTAAELFRGRASISVFDSQTIGLGLNVLVRRAASLNENGHSGDNIIKLTRGLAPCLYGAFITQDLDHLARSGCLRPAQAELGKLLGIIPFLSIEEGQIVAIEKVRSLDRALEKLVEFAAEFESPQELAVVQLNPHPAPQTELLIEMLRGVFPALGHIPIRPCGATVGSIIGPTGIGVMIYEEVDGQR
ncbi:MAG: DegV family protein [Anaerolineae bacterium]|nr:DegV family protein [Thermoflexales bacterium]MDW8408549.1 DegV family protein [Anaerolineae bacterium]